MHLPEDNNFTTMVKSDIPEGMAGFDIGNETVQRYSLEIGGTGKELFFGMVLWVFLKSVRSQMGQ